MTYLVRIENNGDDRQQAFEVGLLFRDELAHCSHWKNAFADKRKDHRFYELMEDTIHEEFEYGYITIRDALGAICAIQPFFVLDQDIVVGASPKIGPLVNFVRRVWPRFLKIRTLMIGCAAGEGHLDGDASMLDLNARLLASAVIGQARRLHAPLIVLKEFPAKYRGTLRCFLDHGFGRIPSMPMTRLNIEYADFDEYMNKALNSATRRKLRKKFKATADAAPIEMSVIGDITPIIDEVYPLYLRVYERSKLHFEKLTKEFLCGLGRRMPDKVCFFVWRQQSKIVAFSFCMPEGDALYTEYIGLDYAVALDLHLYHYAIRDMTSWAMANGYRCLRSSGLNYDPKLHLRHVLDPIDLYVRHVSPLANAILKWVLPLIEPTRYDPTLKKFANYVELWDQSRPARAGSQRPMQSPRRDRPSASWRTKKSRRDSER